MTFFWLVDGEITGWCSRNLNHQTSGSNQSGVSAPSYHSPPWEGGGGQMGGEEGLSVCKTILLCISPEEELGLCFTIITFLAWLLFLCFCILSFLVPAFWNSVKGWGLSRLFLKLRHGEHMGFLYLGSPHRVLLSFNPPLFFDTPQLWGDQGGLTGKESPI